MYDKESPFFIMRIMSDMNHSGYSNMTKIVSIKNTVAQTIRFEFFKLNIFISQIKRILVCLLATILHDGMHSTGHGLCLQ